ncbi:MAG: hypothetical protein AABX08_04350 [Nanoarchaeota archaeon]
MQTKIIQEKSNNFFDRKEIEIEATYEKATPSEAEIKKQISTNLKVNEEVIQIKKIHQVFGARKAKISAHIYKTPEQLKKIEFKNKKKKEAKLEPKQEEKK